MFLLFKSSWFSDPGPGEPGGQDEHPGAALLDLYRHPGVGLRARVPSGAQAVGQGI